MWKIYIFSILLTFPALSYGAGLVPCGGEGEEPCQMCYVITLVSGLFEWLSVILAIIFAIIIIVLGLYITSSGNASAMKGARNYIYLVITGYIIFLAAWMLVDMGMRMLVDERTYGVWNDIQCVAQPTAQQYSRVTASGDNSNVLSDSEVSDRVNVINSPDSAGTEAAIEAAAKANGITDPEQIKVFKALISQESSNCKNKTGPSTSFGTAYGCGQMLVSTAKGLDPSLAGKSDAEIADKLRNDDNYNLALSAKYYSQLLAKNGGDTESALANYNGGNAANIGSRDCPGLKRWQCEWDSPGCYGTSNTSCTPNTGYKETRNYVENITNIADRL